MKGRPHSEGDFWKTVTPTGFCWEFDGRLTDEGYGHFSLARVTKTVLAHRISYQLLIGAIPEGAHLDHLCGVRNCVNPDHLEPVHPGEHTLRSMKHRMERETCVNGHPRDDDNMLTCGDRYYRCRQCVLVRTHKNRGRACRYDAFCGAPSHERVTRRRRVFVRGTE